MGQAYFREEGVDIKVCRGCEFFKENPNAAPNWVRYECSAAGRSSVDAVVIASTKSACDVQGMVKKIDGETSIRMAGAGLPEKLAAKAGGEIKKAIMLDVNSARRALDAGGLGLAVDAAGGLVLVGGALVKAGAAIYNMAKKAALKAKEKKLVRTMEEANALSFSSAGETRESIDTLMEFYDSFYVYEKDGFNLEPLANIIMVKLDTGIRYLKSCTTLEVKEFERFHAKLLAVKQKCLELQYGEEPVPAFSTYWVTMDTISLEGGLKYTVGEIKSLFAILKSTMGLFGEGAQMDLDDKITLGEGSLKKLRQGFDVLDKFNYTPVKIEKFRKQADAFQSKLDKLKAKQARKKRR
ncbi:MAG: hypothetical protein LBK74_08725 [Treponema sp.]|nr:hypothetical protein [Treponema sp.]